MDKFISEYYKKCNQELHEKNSGFGGGFGGKRSDHILPVIDKYNVKTVLDYGAGKGHLANILVNKRQLEVTNYDPCVKGIDVPPTGFFDLVICNDVLEHVEIEYLDNVLEHICSLGRICFFCIGLKESNKTLCDGRNTHITLLDKSIWDSKIENYFYIIDKYIIGNDKFYFIICEGK